ncbi:MAG: hypothetical protein M1822_004584 [Bathelium mastoideum]|nr:MAG: hypothetical protein M1822_004584 [Bathelium mastoideum]
MTHLLRGKQAGIQGDFSAGLGPELFAIDEIDRYGINSQISQIAYDPVQSLLAVGTNDTKFGHGQIYVFGQNRVSATFRLPGKGSVKFLRFCSDRIVCLDSKNNLSIYSLETKKLINEYSPPAAVTTVETDSSLDYALIGTASGDVIAYDMDREAMAPFKLPHFWREQNPKAMPTPVVSLQLHPRDVGTLLIGYSEGAVIYSFKQNKPTKFLHYRLGRGAPGGDLDPAIWNMDRSPKLTQALWHPTGTFILTGHEDSSLVFWDPAQAHIVMARTLQDTKVDQPGSMSSNQAAQSGKGKMAGREPLYKIAWCANKDPDDTGILIAGGAPMDLPTKGLTFFELGRTPVYNTSSWQVLSDHFGNPRRQRVLPTPPNASVVNFCLIPRTSPHFAGAQDPIAVLALLSSGELISLSFPSGLPITPTNQLHISLTFAHPFVNRIALSSMDRTRWLGMTEKRAHGPPILTGGVEGPHPLRRYETRSVVQTAHADGTIRIWDSGHGDEIENPGLLQADVARAVGRTDGVEIAQMSLSGASGELAAGLRSGEVVVFRWGHNRHAGQEPPPPKANNPHALTDVTERKDPSLADGLFPFTLLDQLNGPVSALKLSDVGFVAAGFEGGSLAVIDLRGPAIIYSASVEDFAKQEKRSTFRRNSQQGSPKRDWPTTLEFSIMTLDGDDYSSICLHVGTYQGHVATFRILPDPSGRYTVQFAGSTHVESPIIHLAPLNADSGRPAHAYPSIVSQLRSGAKVAGFLLAVARDGARVFRPASNKGAHRAWDDALCDAAAVVHCDRLSTGGGSYALVGLFGSGQARAYSIPGLKELGIATIVPPLDPRRLADAHFSPTGDILGWVGPAELALLNIWGTGSAGTGSPQQQSPRATASSGDRLLRPEALIPPRPTISNMQWIAGTQYVTPADMDVLIGGPDRPPSRRMVLQARADEQQRRAAARGGASSSSAFAAEAAGAAGTAAGQQDEGYWAYMQRQINERTEKLGIMGDSMDKLETNSAGWAEDVSKFVNRQKRNLVMGAVKSKFGM